MQRSEGARLKGESRRELLVRGPQREITKAGVDLTVRDGLAGGFPDGTCWKNENKKHEFVILILCNAAIPQEQGFSTFILVKV